MSDLSGITFIFSFLGGVIQFVKVLGEHERDQYDPSKCHKKIGFGWAKVSKYSTLGYTFQIIFGGICGAMTVIIPYKIVHLII